VKATANLFSSWDYYTNFEWQNAPKTYVKAITKFSHRGDLKAQVDQVKEIQVKYTYKPEKKKAATAAATMASEEERKKISKRRVVKEAMAATFPPDMHTYRMQQLLQDINSRRQQRATH